MENTQTLVVFCHSAKYNVRESLVAAMFLRKGLGSVPVKPSLWEQGLLGLCWAEGGGPASPHPPGGPAFASRLPLWEAWG